MIASRIGTGFSFVMLIAGWLILRDAFYGAHQTSSWTASLIFVAWGLGFMASVFALNVIYGVSESADRKIIVRDLAAAGLLLNGLSIAAFLLLIFGLRGIR